MGVRSEVSMQSSGEAIEPLGEFSLDEDLHVGTRLCFTVGHDSRIPKLGAPIRLKVTQDEGEGVHELEALLWCQAIHRLRTPGGAVVQIVATDPLGFCSIQRQFTSHAGRMPLLDLTKRVLSRQPGSLAELPAFGTSPTIPMEWLLQDGETGRSFLTRVAREMGYLIFWSRSQMQLGRIGSGPTEEADELSLDFDSGVIDMDEADGADLDDQRLVSIDPETRAVYAEMIAGQGLGGRSGGAPLPLRVASQLRPTLAMCRPEAEPHTWGPRVVARTTRPDVILGRPVRLCGGPEMMVIRVHHTFHAGGSCANTFFAGKRNWWALGGSARSMPVDVLQARVVRNDDPNGQQRVRVVLVEDPDARPTPWIQVVAPAAGPGTGIYWLPEVGDLTLVIQASSSPESLYCLGSLRGREQQASREWRSDDNAWKILSLRDGVWIGANDKTGSIRFQTPESWMELGRDGIRMGGPSLTGEMSGAVKMRGGGEMVLDGSIVRIG